MITVAVMFVVVAVFAVGAVWGCRWILREGFRQGDATNEVSTSVRAFGEGRYITVRTTIANPRSTALIAAVRFQEVGARRPIARQGRSTLRKQPDTKGAELRAVDAGRLELMEQVVERPRPRRALVVDVYIWQEGEKVRLHRHLCGPSQPDPAQPIAWQSAY